MNTWWPEDTEFWWDDATERAKWTREVLTELVEAGWFITRTLDFGCGDMPYRDVVAGEYVPYDKLLVGAEAVLAPFDFILCTWVLQEIRDPALVLSYFREWLAPDGRLFLTVPAIGHWLNIFSPAAIDKLVSEAGFEVEDVEIGHRFVDNDVPVALAVTAKVRS